MYSTRGTSTLQIAIIAAIIITALTLIVTLPPLILPPRQNSDEDSPPPVQDIANGAIEQPPPGPLAPTTVEITSLKDGDSVIQIVLVSGRSSGVYRSENLNLYLLVFPLGTGQWWVQSIPIVETDGSWTSPVFFGRDGEEDLGEVFILLAIITEEKLLPAQIILEADGLPLSEAEDGVVGLVRT